MKGFATGGPIWADDSQEGLNKRLVAMQAANGGASSATAQYNNADQNKLMDTALGKPENDFASQFTAFMNGQSTGQRGVTPTQTPSVASSTGYGSFTNSAGSTFNNLGSATAGRNMDDNYRNAQYGWATGGPINVDGRQVLGAGTGKSDSLPAVIDGEQPAALSTGEFVFPVETVQFFGLDRLNKMVAQSRKGLDTGRGEA
jgi:hypothetical protein